MTQSRFELSVATLAVIFFLSAYCADWLEIELRQLPVIGLSVVGLIVALPFFLTLMLVQKRIKQLELDEYQAYKLRERVAYASMAALFYTLVKGFMIQYKPEAGAPFYVWPAAFWYVTFWFNGLFGPHKP